MGAHGDETISDTAIPTLEDWQHWTLVMGRAQQMLMEAWAEPEEGPAVASLPGPPAVGGVQLRQRPMALMTAGAQAWAKGLETWGRCLAA